MTNDKNRVCPVEAASSLDTWFRRWGQNPRKILKPYIKTGMTTIDMGCGPGFFTLELANMVGNSGKVFAVDLQQGMLDKVQNKIIGTKMEHRITLHKCEADKIGITEDVDFVLAFYVLHELPEQKDFFKEISGIMKPNAQMLVVEPSFHVSKSEFKEMVKIAGDFGLQNVKVSGMLLSKVALFKKD